MWPFKKRTLEEQFNKLLELNEKERMILKPSDFNYVDQINIAFKTNKKLNLEIPDFEFNRTINFSSDRQFIETILPILHEEIYCFHADELAYSCFHSSIIAQRALYENLGLKTLITLGSYSHGKGEKIFYESFKLQKFRLKHSDYHSKRINLHCWLTLPDYSIIDVSILSTLKAISKMENINHRQFYMISGRDQKKGNEQLYYHPQLIGDSYLKKIKVELKTGEIGPILS